eukprot:COSAG05_NODE_1277_length_5304_cov_5.087992_1_plen_374_part_10
MDNILNPFWLWATELLPIWLAPNLVTFLGTGHLLVAYYYLWPYMFTPSDVLPDPAVMGLCAFCFWVYQTMDAMDGKQARRTGASSPLGQLFDHGCDAFALIVQFTAVHIIFGCGPAVTDRRWMFANQGVNQVIFFLAQWTEYHIHVLPTAVGPFGVTEMQYSVIFAFLFGGVFFRNGWIAAMQAEISTDIPFPFGSAFLIIHTTLAAISAMAIVLAVAFGSDAHGDKVDAKKAVMQLVPIVAVGAACGLAFSDDVYMQHPQLLSISSGLLMTHLTNKMIVFCMARQEYGSFLTQWIIFPYIAVGVWSNYCTDAAQLELAMQVLTAAMTVHYLVWATVVIRQISAVNCTIRAKASQPWSKSWPSGEDAPVRRACF